MEGAGEQLIEFVYDAPQYYDFEQNSHGAPADEWFETAPDGPGYKRGTPLVLHGARLPALLLH